jgi:hypothetical protein
MSLNINNDVSYEEGTYFCKRNNDKAIPFWSNNKVMAMIGFCAAVMISTLAVSSATLATQKQMQQTQPIVGSDRSLITSNGQTVGAAAVIGNNETFSYLSDVDIMMMNNIQMTLGSGNNTIEITLRPTGLSKQACSDVSCNTPFIYTFYTSEGNVVQDGEDTYLQNPSENLQKALTLYGSNELGTGSRKLWMTSHEGHRELQWWGVFTRVLWWFNTANTVYSTASNANSIYNGGRSRGWWRK